MEIVFIFVIGLCIGSFLNVCIYRLPKGESISFPPSHCQSCGYRLKVKDLVPVFSYIFLKGKCRNCGEKISIQYPIIELTNAVLYLCVYLRYGLSVETIKYSIFASLLLVIGVIDFKTTLVCIETTIFGIITSILFMGYSWYNTKIFPLDNIIGGAIGFLIIWLIVKLTAGMGEGDIDIALVCGLFLGKKGIAITLFFGIILGGLAGVIFLIARKKGKKDEMAFGPYLAMGAFIALMWGEKIFNWYVSTF
ncbi:MAG: prepilin peptidase [Clostridium sp.]|nr:prepilin peptidase [Clostridium sp.]MCI7444070.1 prepilin peptidase [Clostridium sp.]